MRRFGVLAFALLCAVQTLLAANKQAETFNMQKAYEAFQNQDYQTAVDCLNKELADDAKNGYAYLWMAIAYTTGDDYGSILTYSDKAIQYLPKKDKESRGVAFNLRSSAYSGLGQQDLALADISEAINLDPKDVDYLNSRAQIYFEQFQYELADADAKKITELEPGNPLGWLCLGRNADARKDYDKAIEHYNYAVKLDNSNAQSYSLRAYTYISQKRWSEATDDVVSAFSIDITDGGALDCVNTLADSASVVLCSKMKIQTKKDPNNSLWPFIIGATYEKRGNMTEALEFFNKSFDIEPSAGAAQRLSDAYSDADNLKMALDFADRAIQMDSTDTDGLYSKAMAYFKARRWEDADRALSIYLDAEPERADAYCYRGFTRDHLGKTNEAADDYDTAITLQPMVISYYFRGRHYWNLGDKDKAIADFKQAVEMDTVPDPASPSIMLLGYLGRTDEAEALIAEIGKDAESMVLYNAACYYAMFGDKQKAVDFLNQSVDKGFLRLTLLENDSDMDSIRSMDGYKKVVERLKSKQLKMEEENAEYTDQTVEVPMTKESGVFKVKCSINGLPLHFVFDTGAANVTISAVEAAFMYKNNYLSDKDFMGSSSFLTASGDIIEGSVVNLRNVNFGGLDMNNVKATVVKTQNAPILLGQSVLSRLGKVEIDYSSYTIRITRKVKTTR